MEQNKKKGGAGRVILIILIVLVVLGAAGYFALRAFVQSKIESMGAPDLSSSFGFRIMKSSSSIFSLPGAVPAKRNSRRWKLSTRNTKIRWK